MLFTVIVIFPYLYKVYALINSNFSLALVALTNFFFFKKKSDY